MHIPVLSLKGVNYTYSNGRSFSFSDISLRIFEKSITCILGRNGVGKTTLLLIMLGFLKPTKGTVEYSSKLGRGEPKSKNIKISYLPQYERIQEKMKVGDYMLMGRIPFISPLVLPRIEDWEIVIKYAEMLGLIHLLDFPMEEISGGEFQRVRLGRALVQESDLILLDEPITHLDINAKFKMMDLIKKLNGLEKSIIFSSHDPSEALQISDFALLIHDDHSIHYGETKEIVTNKNLSRCFNMPITIYSGKNSYACIVEKTT